MPVFDCSKERRKHKRFSFKEGIFALLEQSPGNLASIIDGSEGGLGVSYISRFGLKKATLNITIFSNLKIASIRNIPAKVLFDYEVESVQYQSIPIRRCGMQFLDMTLSQKILFEEMMQQFTEKNGD